jgi:hypothetical protein
VGTVEPDHQVERLWDGSETRLKRNFVLTVFSLESLLRFRKRLAGAVLAKRKSVFQTGFFITPEGCRSFAYEC